jgi:alkaline phosphatase D
MITYTNKTVYLGILFSLFFLILPNLHAMPEGTAGPLVGAVKSNQVSLWMLAPSDSVCSYEYYKEGASNPDVMSGKFTPVSKPANEGSSLPFKVTLKNLSPNTHYHFQVKVNDQSKPAWQGSFKTAPVEGEPSSFRLALTSCMKLGEPISSWELLLDQKPSIHLTVGDTHYANTTDPTVQLEHHVAYRRQEEFAKVLRNIPTYSMWDDHDYGPNNSDGTLKGKERSLAGWEQAWANPKLGTTDTPGAFYKFSYGDVDFFMTDTRYYRSRNKSRDNEEKRMLGEAQFNWLIDGLKKSEARFKIIVSGSTLQHSKNDGWRIFTFARHRLLDAIKEHKLSGVMYMSGDIHRSLVWEHQESDRVGYPFVEVISSGIGYGQDLSFATVDFDTTLQDPTVRVRIIYGDGTVHTDKIWKLSQLKHQ